MRRKIAVTGSVMLAFAAIAAFAVLAARHVYLDHGPRPVNLPHVVVGSCKYACLQPKIASNQRGDAVVVWTNMSSSRDDDLANSPIMAAYKTHNGVWKKPVMIGRGWITPDTPHPVVDGGGNVYLEFERLNDPVGVGYPIYVRDAKTGRWLRTLPERGGIAPWFHFGISVQPDRAGAVISWSHAAKYGMNPYALRVASWNPRTDQWQRLPAPASHEAMAATPAVNQRGDIALVWQNWPHKKEPQPLQLGLLKAGSSRWAVSTLPDPPAGQSTRIVCKMVCPLALDDRDVAAVAFVRNSNRLSLATVASGRWTERRMPYRVAINTVALVPHAQRFHVAFALTPAWDSAATGRLFEGTIDRKAAVSLTQMTSLHSASFSASMPNGNHVAAFVNTQQKTGVLGFNIHSWQPYLAITRKGRQLQLPLPRPSLLTQILNGIALPLSGTNPGQITSTGSAALIVVAEDASSPWWPAPNPLRSGERLEVATVR